MEGNVNWALVGLIYGGLLFFGFFYNVFVSWLTKRSYIKGKSSILVVFGTLITVSSTIPLIGIRNMLIVLAAFAASGFCMVVGDLYRDAKKQEEEAAELRRLVNDETTTMGY